MNPDIVAEGAVLLHVQHLRRRNCRPSTIYNRQRALARLARWVRGPVLYLSEDDITRWQNARTEQITPAARRTEISHVREFYRWAVRERLLRDDPTLRVEMPRAPRGLPRPMPDADLALAMASADARQAAVLGLAAFAGLRACEVARLDWSEVGFGEDPPCIRIVEGKGGHGRLTPLAPVLAGILCALPGPRHGPVITMAGGMRHYEPYGISRIANTYLHSLAIGATMHQLRHRFATAMYRACRDLRAVQDVLGHASPATTAIYTAPSQATTFDAVRAASELAA